MHKFLLHSRWGRLIQILSSIALILWLGSRIDKHTWLALNTVSIISFTVCLLIFASAQVFGSWRLFLLLAPSSEAKFSKLLRLTLVSYFLGNFLPSTVGGDVYKGIKLNTWGIQGSRIVSSLFADRLVNILVVFFIAAIVLTGSALARSYSILNLVFPIALGSVMLSVCLVLLMRYRFKLHHRLCIFLEGVNTQLSYWKQRPGLWSATFLLSILSFGCSVTAQILLCIALQISVSAINLTAIICIAFFVTLLPISLNGIGLQEVSYVVLLRMVGIDEVSALSFALLSRCLILGTSLLGGIFFLISPMKR